MNEEYYRIDTATKFYLYGVNYQAKKILHNLIRNGFTVDAIIDRNVNQNNILDAKIISIEMLNDRILGKVNYCIIICLQNALQHDSVVKKLLEYGFSQIIFLPINFNLSDKKANILRKLFNKIIRGENILNAEIPFIHTGAILDDGIIEYSSDEFLYAWIPVELVYTNAVSVADEHVPFIDRPLSVFYPYFELYDFLEGRIEQCEDYFILQQYVKPSIQEDKWKKNILLQRQELIYIFEREFRKGMSFFIASASQAVWNKKGYFNIKDGAHRNIFLIRKGVQYLPLAISKCEYEIWMNTQYFRKYIHKLMNDIIDHPYLIEHPYLEGYNLNWEINYKIGTALEYIFLYKNIESKKIIFYGRYADYYARRINRLNIGKIYLYNGLIN